MILRVSPQSGQGLPSMTIVGHAENPRPFFGRKNEISTITAQTRDVCIEIREEMRHEIVADFI